MSEALGNLRWSTGAQKLFQETFAQRIHQAAIVFDPPVQEVLRWIGGSTAGIDGLFRSIDETVGAVIPLHTLDSGLDALIYKSKKPQKLVFLTGSFVWDQWACIKKIVKRIASSTIFNEITEISLLCSISEEFHSGLRPSFCPNDLVFSFCAREFRRCFQTTPDPSVKIPTIVVDHFSLLHSVINQHLFLIPSCADFLSLPLDAFDLHSAKFEWDQVPSQQKERIALVTTSLDSFLEDTKISGEQIFTLGPNSQIIGEKLSHLRQSHEKEKEKDVDHSTASFLIIDRVLDLVTPCCHNENLFDRIMASIPRHSPCSSDLSVDMSPLLSDEVALLGDEAPRGSIAFGDDEAAQEVMTQMIQGAGKEKEALVRLRKSVVDAFLHSNIEIDISKMMRGNVNSKQLLALIEVFRDNPTSIWKNSSLIQILLAAYQALESGKSLMWDELLAVEKVFFLTAAKYPESLIKQLVDLLSTNSRTEYKIQDILSFALLAYSLAGTGHGISSTEEEQFQKSLLSRIERNESDLAFLRSLFQPSAQFSDTHSSSSSQTPLSPLEVHTSILKHLKFVQKVRSHLQQHNDLLINKPGYGFSFKGIIQQVSQMICDESHPELADLQHVSRGLRGFFKSGFSRFGLQSRPRPADHKTLIVFVVGGITATEIKTIHETCSKTFSNVVIGSTELCSASSLLHNSFLPSPR